MSISFETARKLKEAGLKWESKVGDYFYFNNTNNLWLIKDEFSNRKEIKLGTFAPRLDQLLSDIEKRSGRYKYELTGSRVYPLSNNPKPKYRITIQTDRVLPFFADSPEEATAQALLWILKQVVRP